MSKPAGKADRSATLQSRLEEAPEDDAGATAGRAACAIVADPVALLRHLDGSGHFHRDSRLGRMYHPGMVSLREDVPSNSLHVSVDDNRLTAHVDEVSPLAVETEGGSRYSLPRTVAHNLSGMARDVVLMLRGRQGDHRCELNCEWVSSAAEDPSCAARLLDPRTTAWSVQLEARVTGRLDEGRLRDALDATVGDQRKDHDLLEVVECESDDMLALARSRLYGIGVPITRRPPLQACLARNPAGDVLMLNLNHAASDGIGASHVLDAIARAYAEPARPAVALDFLAGRDLPVRPAVARTSIVVRVYRAAMARVRERLAPSAGLAVDEPAEDPGHGFHRIELTEQTTREVNDAEGDGTHRNVLLTALHLAIGDWNRRHDMPGRQVGVLVPTDLRPADWRPSTIGNLSVNTRLSTRRRQRSSPASALEAITTQSVRSTRTRTGIALIAALQRAGMLALWAKQSRVVLEEVTANHLVDAALLCNLGTRDPGCFGADAGETAEVWFSIPARSPLSLSVGAVTVAGRLHITLRYPRRLFSVDAARRFADCYVAHVARVCAASA